MRFKETLICNINSKQNMSVYIFQKKGLYVYLINTNVTKFNLHLLMATRPKTGMIYKLKLLSCFERDIIIFSEARSGDEWMATIVTEQLLGQFSFLSRLWGFRVLIYFSYICSQIFPNSHQFFNTTREEILLPMISFLVEKVSL